MFLETSALTGENVEEAFLTCSKSILGKIAAGEVDPGRPELGVQYSDEIRRRLRETRQEREKSDCMCIT
ncbi:unnamed protein product [Darwinula stevensoni]|uniref:Uncharacterized protein n=1 Tax=Darwinula stevensoni TaxID=69355 RepID=A0A7R8X7Y9_9CRUS|nr:unnamed protein product [Darwinula stevensoni]CAG0888236.1 unnamed protein product [Darwinula stevensoni]